MHKQLAVITRGVDPNFTYNELTHFKHQLNYN